MIITLKNADFSANNIGTLSSFNVLYNLGTGAIKTAGATNVEKNGRLDATITITEGYELDGSVVVTMGGVTQNEVVSISGNVITIAIPSVVGNVIIKAPTKSMIDAKCTITYKYVCEGVSIKSDTTETVDKGTVKTFNISNAPIIEGYAISSVSPTSATINDNITVTYTYTSSIVEGDMIDITSLFDFKYEGKNMNTNTDSPTMTTSAIFKTSSFFDSASADVEAYAGKTIKIMIPAYTSSTNKLSGNVIALVDSQGDNPKWVKTLHIMELSPLGVAKTGRLVEYTIELPSNAKYLFTSIFNNSAVSNGVVDTKEGFYCKVIN